MSTFTTYTKIHFNHLAPTPESISLVDISHALSMITRATGHFPQFYSVGQHCINCCNEAEKRGLSKRIILACLLHDAAECYISDVTRSVKELLPKYTELEENLLKAIYSKFLGSPLTDEEAGAVKEIDDTILYYEMLHFMDEKIKDTPPELLSQPVFYLQGFNDVENTYFKKANTLIQNL